MGFESEWGLRSRANNIYNPKMVHFRIESIYRSYSRKSGFTTESTEDFIFV